MLQNKIIPKTLFVGSILLLHLFGCQTNSVEEKTVALPNTPESVSKAWQYALDKNDLESVAILSTPSTLEWLDQNRDLFMADNQVYTTQFLKMDCQVSSDSIAICQFTMKAEGEIIEDFYALKKIENQWLVEIADDTTGMDLEEQFFQEMEKELNLNQKI